MIVDPDSVKLTPNGIIYSCQYNNANFGAKGVETLIQTSELYPNYKINSDNETYINRTDVVFLPSYFVQCIIFLFLINVFIQICIYLKNNR